MASMRLMNYKLFLGLAILLCLVSSNFAVLVSACQNLNVANTVYVLSQNISGAGLAFCINITAANITFDGNTTSGPFRVASALTNADLISIQSVNNTKIQHMILGGPSTGGTGVTIHIATANNTTLDDVNMTASNPDGIMTAGVVTNVNITNSLIVGQNTACIDASSSASNTGWFIANSSILCPSTLTAINVLNAENNWIIKNSSIAANSTAIASVNAGWNITNNTISWDTTSGLGGSFIAFGASAANSPVNFTQNVIKNTAQTAPDGTILVASVRSQNNISNNTFIVGATTLTNSGAAISGVAAGTATISSNILNMSSGIGISNPGNGNVTNNTILGFNATGISLTLANEQNTNISGNILNSTAASVTAIKIGASTINNTLINLNTINLTGATSVGINITNSTGNNITNNTIQMNTTDGLALWISGVAVSPGSQVYYNNFKSGHFYVNNSNNLTQFNTTVGGFAQGNNYSNISLYQIFDLHNPLTGYGNGGSDYPVNGTKTPGLFTSDSLGSDFGPVAGPLAPVVNSVLVKPGTAYVANSIFCQVNATGNYSTTFNITYNWFKNGVNQTALAGTNSSYSNNTLGNVSEVLAGNLSVGDNWSCSAFATDIGGNSSTITSGNVTITAAGFFLCDANFTTNTINYSFYDENTQSSLNATLLAIYTFNAFNNTASTINATNNTTNVCISPSTASINAIATEYVSASGYNAKQLLRPSQNYSNVSVNRAIYLLNTSLATSVLIGVYNTNFQPKINYTVILYKFETNTNTFVTSNVGLTNAVGQDTEYVQGFPASYAIAVLDDQNVLQTNITTPLVTFCTAVTAGNICTYNIYLGIPLSPNYYDINSTLNQPFATNTSYTSGSNNITFYGGPDCSFNNSTFRLSCSYPNASMNPNFLGANLTLYNFTNANNQSQIATVFNTSQTTAILSVPNVTGRYIYSFFMTYQNTTNGSVFNYTQYVESGKVNVNPPTKNPFGADGWMLAIIVVLGVVFATWRSPPIMIITTTITLLFCGFIQLITLDIFTATGLALIGAGLAYWARD